MNARQLFMTSRVEINLQSVIRISRDDEPPQLHGRQIIFSLDRYHPVVSTCIPHRRSSAKIVSHGRRHLASAAAGWRRAATFLQGTFKKSPSIAFSASSRFN
jgi:hypothetical protein